MAESDERPEPTEPEGEQEAVDDMALDPPLELEADGVAPEGSSGFGELSLNIFAADEVVDDDDVEMPDDLAEVDILRSIIHDHSKRKRLCTRDLHTLAQRKPFFGDVDDQSLAANV